VQCGHVASAIVWVLAGEMGRHCGYASHLLGVSEPTNIWRRFAALAVGRGRVATKTVIEAIPL
jgi:hypothetical protein